MASSPGGSGRGRERGKERAERGGGGRGRRALTLDVRTTTGGAFRVQADSESTVEQLKRVVSRRLRVPKERICLLHRDAQLRDGTLEANGLEDGSRLVLMPSLETGLLGQRPDNSVMQALESLDDSQVADFLSGASPLNLTMRLGDHMMLIQLQLSTHPGRAPRDAAAAAADAASARPGPSSRPAASARPTFLRERDIETLQSAFEIFKSLAEMPSAAPDDDASASAAGSSADPCACAAAPKKNERLHRLLRRSSAAAAAAPPTPVPTASTSDSPPPPAVVESESDSDSDSLREASKNLTQTLKKLSKEVLAGKADATQLDVADADRRDERGKAPAPKTGQGAVIESMKHHGKGIYSGTFSGTLNPALQDRFGRPKRDISTIVHILNDLLCATPPQYRRGARIAFEPTHNPRPVARIGQRELESRSTPTRGAAADECDCVKCADAPGGTTCPYGECDGHYPAPPTPLDPPEACACGKRAKRDEVATLASDNSKTKCKLDRLRLVMQQKKQRREARKAKAAPYSAPGSALGAPDAAAPAEEIEAPA